MPQPITVVIVDDQRDIREGLRFLIDHTAGYRCGGTFQSVEEALPYFETSRPDIVLMDLGLPGMSGIEGIRRLKADRPDLRFVALTIYEDDHRIFEALCAGASGYVLKKTPPARLLECLQEVITGGAPMSPEVASRVIALFRQFRPATYSTHNLTPHEVRLLGLLAQGYNYKTAAEALGNSVNTVAFHMKHIYTKLQVHSKSEAVAKALRDGIVR